MALTIEALKLQKRWVLWRLEKRDGKETKIPYQVSGRKADSTNPATWSTYAACAALASQYSGVGVVLGTVDGVTVWGVDIDKCCDAAAKTWTPESREIVIALDSYAEYSPSGTGCHILGIGDLRGRKGIKLPYPGAKAVEVYDHDRYLTFTGRHLSKTPNDLTERQDAVNALYDRVQASKPHALGLTVAVTVSEEERLNKLMAGDMSLHNDDHSAADFALCCLLAKKYACNPFKVADEFLKSGLYREKWDRDDYRENTITRACMAVAREVPVIDTLADEDPLSDDAPVEFLVDTGEEDGWFPFREISVIGGPSGVGKTTWALLTFEALRAGESVWGHAVKPRDYRVLMGDRSKTSVKRTVKR